MNLCKKCGKETKNKIFCSIECKSEYMSKPKGNCKNCGKILDRCEVFYCSKYCYNEFKKKENQKNLIYNKCIICGKDTLNEKYCSAKCMGKDNNRKETAINNLKNKHNWTKEEIDYLKENYGKIRIKDICEHLGLNQSTIIAYASKNNISSHRRWTEEQLKYLEKHKDDSIESISTSINKTKNSIYAIYSRMNGFSDRRGKQIISPQKFISDYIKSLNIKFEEEVKIGKFITDIFVYGIDIEIQGTYWHVDERFYDKKNLTKEQLDCINKDLRKKEYFESIGIPIVYIWEYDIYSNPQKVKKDIKQLLKKYKRVGPN